MNKRKIKFIPLYILCILICILIVWGGVEKFFIFPSEWEMMCVSGAVIPNYYYNGHTSFHIRERDSYGRYLYLSSFCDMGSDFYMIIVQASQDDNASYYAEVCLFTTDSWRDINKEEYESFKEQNDWGKPLNYEKMTWCEID